MNNAPCPVRYVGFAVIRVQVKNFQSIAKSSVVIDGLTIVTGANNSGKSALMRAIRGVFTNTKGSGFVRHGEDSCEVTLEFADGKKVVWEKGKTINRYTVNGKLLDKVGQGVPPEVEALGVQAIVAGNQSVWPQIAPQFTGQVFLLDQPGSVLAEALADVERVGKLARALKACESDKRQATAELKVRRADQKALALELAAFDGMGEALQQVTSVESSYADLCKSQSEIERVQELAQRHSDLQQQVDNLLGIRAVSVPSVADADLLRQSGLSLHDLSVLRARLTTAQTDKAKYEGADKLVVPTSATAESLRQEGTHIQDLTALRCRLSSAQADKVKYEGAGNLAVPTVADAQSVQNTKQELDSLTALRDKKATAKAACVKLSGFAPPDMDAGKTERASKAIVILTDLRAQRETALAQQVSLQAEVAVAQSELDGLSQTVREILDQMPTCPTCGQGHTGGNLC